MTRRITFGFLLLTVLSMLATACHTAHGFGEDMQDAGQKIQDKTQ